jgi:hypothetical protein
MAEKISGSRHVYSLSDVNKGNHEIYGRTTEKANKEKKVLKDHQKDALNDKDSSSENS